MGDLTENEGDSELHRELDKVKLELDDSIEDEDEDSPELEVVTELTIVEELSVEEYWLVIEDVLTDGV